VSRMNIHSLHRRLRIAEFLPKSEHFIKFGEASSIVSKFVSAAAALSNFRVYPYFPQNPHRPLFRAQVFCTLTVSNE
jgi:hypothetical protein